MPHSLNRKPTNLLSLTKDKKIVQTKKCWIFLNLFSDESVIDDTDGIDEEYRCEYEHKLLIYSKNTLKLFME